jgi:hypothetical protein
LLLPAAVEASLEHLRALRRQREQRLKPILEREEERLDGWRRRREKILLSRLAALPEGHPEAKRMREELAEMDRYLKDRRLHWKESHFLASEEPATRLVLVIEGVA